MRAAVRDDAGVIRARRYVSAPAGVYPAAVPPMAAHGASESAPWPAAAHAGESAPVSEPIATPVESTPSAASTPSSVRIVSRPERGRLAGVLGTLAGVVVGSALGAASSIGLLILALEEPVWSRWNDPVGLWNATPDVMVRAGAALVGVGFLMIGISLFMGIGSSRDR